MVMIATLWCSCDDVETYSEMKEKENARIEKFIKKLPEVKTLLLKDIEALYEGDPAAQCREEVKEIWNALFHSCLGFLSLPFPLT